MRWLAVLMGWGVAVYAGIALYLYAFQARHVYFPDLPSRAITATPGDIGLAYETVRLGTADGETLAGWFVPAANARGTLLYLHGNAGNIGHRVDVLDVFHRLGLDVLIIDYRGYGESTGTPNEAGTYLDAQAAWEHLTRARRIAPDRIVYFGESLGGAIAARLAADATPAGLILYAAFTSVPDLAQELYPLFPAARLARYHYDTRAALQAAPAPVLILHGGDDEIVPFRHGKALQAAALGPARLVELSGGHNDALATSRAHFAREVGVFLDGIFGARAEAP